MIKLTDKEFQYLINYVQRNFGIDLHKKRVLLEGRLSGYLQEHNYATFTEYIKAVEADRTGIELTNLLNKITTNHTYFMREAEHFQFLKSVVLPEWESRITDRDLRVWCAASSTGEEPYTLSMIMQDHFIGRVPAWNPKLLATDLSLKVLEIASNGIYPLDSIKEIPASWKSRYFTQYDAKHVQVKPEVRSKVQYRRFNLMDKIVVRKPFHVVFCRNVMIYFDTQTKADLANRIYDALMPGGYLFIGCTESLPKPNRFRYVRPSIYQKG